MTKEELKSALDKVTGFLELVARFTPSSADDKVVAFLKEFKEQEWFLELLVNLMNLFEKGEKETVAKLGAELNAKIS